MKVAIFGGTGMLGFAVAKCLTLNGLCVDIISRRPTKYLNKAKYKGFNIIEKLDDSTSYNICINLAGGSGASRRTKSTIALVIHSHDIF